MSFHSSCCTCQFHENTAEIFGPRCRKISSGESPELCPRGPFPQLAFFLIFILRHRRPSSSATMRASKYAVLAFLLPLVAGAASRRTGFLAPPQLATSKKPAMTPHKQLVSESSSSVVGSVSFGARSNPLSMSRPRRTSVMTMGLFGLGGPEIVIILAVGELTIQALHFSSFVTCVFCRRHVYFW